MQGYKISSDQSDFDFNVIHSFIANSYWATGMPKNTLQKAIKNSLCFAVLKDNGEQVGFARIITDKSTFAYLADVFILQSERGIGLSKWLLATITAHPDLQGLRRMMLATQDAHGLYESFGFKSIDNPECLMQICQPDVYKQ